MSQIGHNSEPVKLTEDQQRALAYHHVMIYERALRSKKDADAAFKNTCKLIKAEGTTLDDVKALIRLDTPDGEKLMKAEVVQTLRLAKWAGAEFGTQFSLLDIPDSPLNERAYSEGLIAGYRGAESRSPYQGGEPEQEWLRGYADGQKTLMETLDLTKAGMAQMAKDAEEAATKREERRKAKKMDDETPATSFKDQLATKH